MSMFTVKKHRLAATGGTVPFVKSPNIGGTLVPQFLVIHYTASGPGADVAGYFAKPAAKVSAHLVIGRDGSVTQCVPFDMVGWHAGKSRWIDRKGKLHEGLNRNAIGIEIENWGKLKRVGNGWVSWTGASVDPARVIEARHRLGGPAVGWEVFTEAQIEATLQAALAICEAYGIEEILGHDDISYPHKTDPGPAWDMASFRARVQGRAEDGAGTLVVRSPTGLNLRAGAGIEHALLRPEPLPDGTKVILHERDGQWCLVTVLDKAGKPAVTGWVHGGFLYEV
jgi:N-acetylmuramoyl-L-alanine amidase